MIAPPCILTMSKARFWPIRDRATVEAFRKFHAEPGDLIRALAWSAFATAAEIASRIAPDPAAARPLVQDVSRSGDLPRSPARHSAPVGS
jgi:hypothetical protein